MATERVEYRIDLKDKFSPGLKKAQANASKFQSGLGKLTKVVGGVFAAAAVGSAIKEVARLGIEMEQTRVSFTTFLGGTDEAAKGADRLIGQLNKFANVTPFTNSQILQAGKGLLAFGVATDELQPALRAIGDISAGTGKDFNELATIYGKARVAGTLYAEDINQLVEAGVPIMGEFAKALGTSEDQVKKLASEGKLKFKDLETAFANLTGEGGQFFQLMEKQSQTVGGRISTLKGTLETVGIAIGEKLLPVLGSFVDGLSDLVTFFRESAGNLKQVFAPLRALFDPIIKAIQKISARIDELNEGASLLEGIFNAIGNALEFLKPVFQAVGDLIGDLLTTIFEIGVAIGDFIKRNDKLRKAIFGFATAARAVFLQVAKTAKSALGGIGDLVVGIFSGNIDQIQEGLGKLGDALIEGNTVALGKAAFDGFQEGFGSEAKGFDFFGGSKPGAPGGGGLSTLTAGAKAALTQASTTGKPKGGPKGGLSEVRGQRPVNFNITIGNLVEDFSIETKNTNEAAEVTKDKILEAMLLSLRDTQIIGAS